MIHPLTALAVGASGWILTMGINTPLCSGIVLAAALLVGTLSTRNLSLVAAVAALAAPVALSMLIIHAPYGERRIAPLLTADGLAVAGELALRFTALMACLLAAVTFIRVPELAKSLQVRRGGNRLSYLIGSTLQLFPQAIARIGATRDANGLITRPITVRTVVPNIALPVLTELLTMSAARGRALETAGYDLPGHRTILRPVHDSPTQRALRWCVPAVCLVVAVWI